MTQKLPLQFTVLKWQKYKTRMTCKNKQTPKQNSATDSISIFLIFLKKLWILWIVALTLFDPA